MMEPDNIDRIDQIIADLDRHIASVLAIGHVDTAMMLKMAKLDLLTKRNGVSADDLRRLSAALDGGGAETSQQSAERGPQRGGRRLIEVPRRSARVRSPSHRARKSPG